LDSFRGYHWVLGKGKANIDVNAFGQVRKAWLETFIRPVAKYSLEGKKIDSYKSTREAALANGITASYIATAANGRVKTAKGFIWKFE
jgi:hypothetical protein